MPTTEEHSPLLSTQDLLALEVKEGQQLVLRNDGELELCDESLDLQDDEPLLLDDVVEAEQVAAEMVVDLAPPSVDDLKVAAAHPAPRLVPPIPASSRPSTGDLVMPPRAAARAESTPLVAVAPRAPSMTAELPPFPGPEATVPSPSVRTASVPSPSVRIASVPSPSLAPPAELRRPPRERTPSATQVSVIPVAPREAPPRPASVPRPAPAIAKRRIRERVRGTGDLNPSMVLDGRGRALHEEAVLALRRGDQPAAERHLMLALTYAPSNSEYRAMLEEVRTRKA